MTTASFLTFATLLVLLTLSWSQPGEAEPTSDHGNPERAAVFPAVFPGRKKKPCAQLYHYCHDVQLPCCDTRQECKITNHNMGQHFGLQTIQASKTCVWKPVPRSNIFYGGRYNSGRFQPGQGNFYHKGAGSIRVNGRNNGE